MNEPTPYPPEAASTAKAALPVPTPRASRWLAAGAITGPLLFTLAWVILGQVSPGFTINGALVAPYSPIAQPISGLGLGPTAPYMNGAFVIGGLLIVAGAVGIAQRLPKLNARQRWSSALLLAPTGVGMVLSGLFTLEAFLPHTLGALLALGTPVLSFVVVGRLLRRIERWRRFGTWLLMGSPLTLLLLVLSFATLNPVAAGQGLGIAGLTQRVVVLEVMGWFAALGWLALRN